VGRILRLCVDCGKELCESSIIHLLSILMAQFLSRFVTFTVWFLLGTAVVMALGIAWPKWEAKCITQESDWGYLNKKTAEWKARESKQLDIAFFGSSTCYSGIDPAAFEAYGLDAFNFCSISQSPQLSAALANALLEEAPPRTLVVDLYPGIWNREANIGVESIRAWIVNSNLWGTPWSGVMWQQALRTCEPYTVFLAGYFNLRSFLFPTGTRATPDPWGRYGGSGFVHRLFPALNEEPVPRNWMASLPDHHLEALLELQEQCESKGVELLLLVSPVFSPPQVKIAEQFPSVRIINGNDWPQSQEWWIFYDDHHQTSEGSQLYSSWLANRIVEDTSR